MYTYLNNKNSTLWKEVEFLLNVIIVFLHFLFIFQYLHVIIITGWLGMRKKILKKNNKKYLKQSKDTNISEPSKIIYNVVAVIITFCLMYLLIAWVNGDFKKVKQEKEQSSEVSIQNDEILYGSVFTKKDKEYLVLFFDTDNVELDVLKMVVSKYRELEKLPLFVVDLNNKLNESILVKENEQSNKKPTTSNNLKVISPTLIRIKSGKTTKYIEEKNNIMEYFESISK